MSKRQNKLLIKRGDIWYYQRRVPLKFGHVEARLVVRITLDTSSIDAEFIDGYLQLSNNRKRDLRKYMQQIS